MTLADLTAAGAVQPGCNFAPFNHTAYPGNFPNDGNWTPIFGSSPPTPAGESARPAARPEPPRQGGVRYTMTSPTIARYLRLRLEHPEAIVFLTSGAFCQAFFEDGVFCGRELGLAVRNLAADSEPERIPASGFPRRALEKYEKLLRHRGRSVHVA
ncbi:MAG: hypothetical protein IT294_16575 [Deltaproteobacteria bacterium]|nr:hypothetical protein [Deltaproteobacteria bacterium]